MLNLIRMDLRRLFVSKSYRVMIVVTAALSIFFLSLIFFVPTGTSGNVTVTGPSTDVSAAAFVMSIMAQGPALAIFAVFYTLFVMAEQKGFIKNIAGQLPHRGMLILSKLPVALVMTLTCFVTTVAVGLAYFAVLGRLDRLGSFDGFLQQVAVLTLLYLAFAALVLFLSAWLRNQAGVMTLAILMPAGTLVALYNGINYLMTMIFGSLPFDMTHYSIEFAMNMVPNPQPVIGMTHIVLLGVGYLFVFASAASMIQQSRDIG